MDSKASGADSDVNEKESNGHRTSECMDTNSKANQNKTHGKETRNKNATLWLVRNWERRDGVGGAEGVDEVAKRKTDEGLEDWRGEGATHSKRRETIQRALM